MSFLHQSLRLINSPANNNITYTFLPCLVTRTQTCTHSIDHTIPVEGLHCEPGIMHLLSYSSRQIKAWRIQQLYTQTALTGNKVNFLASSTHPKVPLRILASCADSAVRLISPVSGDVITTVLLPIGRDPISLVYFGFKGNVHVHVCI